MKILAIVGSPRLKGNTNYLVDRTLEEAAGLGMDTEKIVLSQYKVNPCLGHDDCASFESCLQGDDAGWILDRFREADGIILATPVYYYNVSAQMKAFLDRNYWLYKHDQKYKVRAVGIIVVAEQIGIEDTLYTLKQFSEDFDVSDGGTFMVTGYANKLGDAKKNFPLMEEARNLGREMALYLKELDSK
ncbi:flavodoxin family protein [Chloroflexota bacterium]